MYYRYYVVYHDYSGRIIKKLVESYSDWYSCINDIISQLGCSVTNIISISVDIDPPVKE